ncbi:unnamed protein product [Ceutorhynchus assimilis]|uniref:C2H2-type domain-containing protein n=1 Tax=Ceutorhynchus assimilis TaxID=467358 RepID=A0A9N9QHF6_9CUCU|nr:unnamed protein product [Ceutorhynchus assimilis]
MVVTKNTRRTKKPIETTLGKAPDKPKQNEKDISALRQPIETSVRGAKELAALLQTGTDEVKDLISYECDLMYECRICRSIFRCLSNFVLHKRKYCLEKFNPACNIHHDEIQIVGPSARISMLDKIVERLRETEAESEASKESLTWNVDDLEDEASRFNHIVLEKIDSTDSGIFQSLVNGTCNKSSEFTKTQVMENYKKLENDVPVLDPEGKICGYTSNKIYNQSLFPKCNVSCHTCSQKFATRKSLNNHVKSIHSPSRLLYFCPSCKETLANPRCVYRHLLRVHNLPCTQVEKMRHQINNNCKVLRKDENSIKIKKRAEPTQSNNDSVHQWVNDMEVDKDFHMCVGCGTHFERKAALQGHLQMCTKKKEEKVDKAKSNKMPMESKKITGALKRKRPTIHSCPKKRIILLENIDEENSTGIEEKLNLLENNNVVSSTILNHVITETSDNIVNIENEMQEVLTESVNKNGIPTKITEDGAEASLSSGHSDDTASIRSNNVESLLLDHSPQQNSNFSDACASSRDNLEVIELEDDVESEPDLLSDGVSFEMFYQQLDNQDTVIEQLPEADTDVIFVDEGELIVNNIIEEIIYPMNLQQEEDEKIINPNKAEAIKQEQQADDEETNNIKTRQQNVHEAVQIKQEEQADEELINETETVQQADAINQNDQQISETEKQNTEAAEEEANTQTIEPEEDISHKKKTFPECALPFMTPLELLCIPCDKKFNTNDELHSHMSGHFSWFRFQCTECSFVSFREEDCIMHAQERHSLEQNACIVPLPSWRAESIFHSFKPFEDDNVVGGAYIDEEIREEEIIKPIIADSVKSAVQESDSLLFGSLKNNTNDKELAQSVIDIKETIVDDHLLPEPIEMACPVTNNNALDNDENESSDDWGVSEVFTTRRKTGKKKGLVKKPMPEPVPIVRAARMRTKVQQDDFFYYDSNMSLNDFTRNATVPATSKKKREK